MKKTIVLMLCMSMLLTAVACGVNKPRQTEPQQTKMQQEEPQEKPDAIIKSEDDTVQIPDPFTTCESVEEFAAVAGLELTAPESINGSNGRVYRAIKGEMAEIIYLNASGEEICRIRKASGSDDISGDYNDYSEINMLTVDEVTVSYRGETSKVYVANWTIGQFSYSMTIENGMDTAAVSDIVKGVK